MPAAARVDEDRHTCPLSTYVRGEEPCCGDAPVVEKKHVGGPLREHGAPKIKTNNKPAAKTGVSGPCEGVAPVSNTIVTGSSTVKMHNQLAVREGDLGAHAGSKVSSGSTNVKIGGAMAGATLGPPGAPEALAATKACQEAAEKGRGGKGAAQGKAMNCGMESVRQLCLQKCMQDGQKGPACKYGHMNQDEMYDDYLKNRRDEHNQIALKNAGCSSVEEYKKKQAAQKEAYDKIVAENEAAWKIVEEHGWVYPHEYASLSAQMNVKEKGLKWQGNQGQTIWCFHHKADKNSYSDVPSEKSETKVYIKPLPEEPMPPILGEESDKEGVIGSYSSTRESMLKECGIETEQGNNQPSDIAGDLSDGPVLAVVDVGALPPPEGVKKVTSGAHTVTVTQMTYNEKGELVSVVMNDTSSPDRCGYKVDGAVFENSLIKQAPTNTTKL